MNNKHKLGKTVIGATVVAVALIIIVLICSSASHTLVLQDARSGEVYKRFPIKDDTFTVTFVHSVNKSPVTDIYIIRDNSIYMDGTIYYGFGAGVPDELSDSEKLSYGDNGEMIISGMDLKIPSLVYVVGTVSDHVLNINGEDYSLRSICGKNSHVAFIPE